ncbi:MAG TPA: glutamyl-tRNA reductase [Longimicrobiaceae bacterium]|nr:glutamyl-tRNA reductase [Longimicrobiaceae bacterium]
MTLAVVGASHRTAPIEVRERLAFGRAELPAALARLAAEARGEAVLLSTCNRTEVYLALPGGGDGAEAARGLLASRLGAEAAGAARWLYEHRDRAAAAHLYRVAAGMDSMILGEPQILGQAREAYEAARETADEHGSVVGPALNRLFQSAFSVAGRVRSETGLGRGAASVPSAAVELARKIFGSLRGRRALVLGAGEMSEITLECLRGEGVRAAVVANRTHARACELAARLGGEAIRWDGFDAALPGVDIVVCSTAAPHPVLTRERFRAALPGGAPRPLCIIDIALPRDVEPAVGDEPNVFLYNVDDLQQVVEDNLGRRREELAGAEAIIARGVEEFWSWYASLAVVPTIRALREQGEAVRRAEVERALRQLAHLSAADQDAIDALTRALVNKLLHAPTVKLRDAAGNGRGTAAVDTVRYLFELDPDAHPSPHDQETE